MKVQLNNEVVEITSDKLQELITSKSLQDKKGIALAINEEIIPRDKWDSTSLNENDKILIITATQGG